ncbi:MAG: potassium channel family protein [Bacteroidota bacterium]
MTKLRPYLAFLYRYRFLFLWITFLVEFIAPSFIEHDNFMLDSVLSTLSILAGMIVLLARKRLFIVILILGLFVIVESFFNNIISSLWLATLSNVLLIVFYIIIVYEIFRELLDFSKVDLNTIGALLAGFFVLGVMGGVVFTLTEINFPNSFTGLSSTGKPHSELVYFSFVTLTTIGYGDISPITQFAQRVTILFGLIGNFYSTVIIGIIISKFLAARDK